MNVIFTWADGTKSTLNHESATRIEVEGLDEDAVVVIDGRRWITAIQESVVQLNALPPFMVGDHVRLVCSVQHLAIGLSGVIRSRDNTVWGVDLPGIRGGHNCNGLLTGDTGWWCTSEQLELIMRPESVGTPQVAFPACETPCEECGAALGSCRIEGAFDQAYELYHLDGRCLDRVQEVHDDSMRESLWYHEDCVPEVDDGVDRRDIGF